MLKKFLVSVCLLVSLALPAQAQTNHKDLVAFTKSTLMAQGVDLSGACGAFQITKRVAWALRGEGYGLLGGKTSGQNGCPENGDKYAVDWLLKSDGTGVDVLGDAGGQNSPDWIPGSANAAFYRPAFDPGGGPVVVPTPTPTPAPVPVVDLEPLKAEIAALHMDVRRIDEMMQFDAQFLQRHDQIIQELQHENELLAARIFELEKRVVPIRCVVSAWGIKLGCKLE